MSVWNMRLTYCAMRNVPRKHGRHTRFHQGHQRPSWWCPGGHAWKLKLYMVMSRHAENSGDTLWLTHFLLTIWGMCWHAWDLDKRKNIVPCLNDLWDCVRGISRSHPRASPPIWLTGQSPAWKGLLLQKSSTFWPWDVLKGIPQNIGVVGLWHHLLWCKSKFVCMCAVYILHIQIDHIPSHMHIHYTLQDMKIQHMNVCVRDSTCGSVLACFHMHGTTAKVCHTSSTENGIWDLQRWRILHSHATWGGDPFRNLYSLKARPLKKQAFGFFHLSIFKNWLTKIHLLNFSQWTSRCLLHYLLGWPKQPKGVSSRGSCAHAWTLLSTSTLENWKPIGLEFDPP